ncbi:hypoxic response protein 1 [Clostridium acetireducens DSM 10703]|jgi:CBS domain-containing protein|uniref:Hypoxic response protein 1 n=1 Tax=Clostridium acetireducens DSM 10703 TaxID=1121290 RepID=A0A1E8EWU2_9CLOT|nr:CBS domain-containing protein [Clostridium acetireducens]OFI05084.1 hypoxic response protein 1 [Clostridium acetireducens DSM 10703]
MNVKDIMTSNVVTLKAEDSIEKAAQCMKRYDIGSVPVCSENKVVGIVTDRDIALRSVSQGKNVKNQTVREIMSSNPVVVQSNTDINKASSLMSERQIRRLPVVEGNNIVGMVSLGDIAVQPKLQNEAGDALSDISEPASPTL